MSSADNNDFDNLWSPLKKLTDDALFAHATLVLTTRREHPTVRPGTPVTDGWRGRCRAG
jgi:hypothetical protein